MASSTSDEIIRLFKCYVETVTDVMKGVVDEKLLLPNHWTLEQYLEDKKHLFYHQTGTFKTLTCSCPAAGCSLRRTHTINQKVFESLYVSTGNVEIGHEIKQNGRVEQTCIHKYVPKNLGIDDLDIGTMCFMLTTTATLSANEMSSVTIIRNYRNVLCHNWSQNHYSALSVNKMWTELESSLLTLTCKPYVQRMVRTEFLHHKNYVISTEEISEILEKMSMVTQDVNQLPSRSDFDNFKNVCLNRLNTVEATISAIVFEQNKTVREDIGRDTEKLLQAIGNATFSTNYPKHKLVPVPQNGCNLQGESKILWHIETPDSWDLENVEATVKDNTQLEEQPIKIKFVKTGSLYLLTTVPKSILNSPANFEMAVKSFLENLVDICKFDTSMPCHVEVHLSFLEEGNDTKYQPTSNQQESRSITSISTQTDVIDIRCPRCEYTTELDFEDLDLCPLRRTFGIERLWIRKLEESSGISSEPDDFSEISTKLEDLDAHTSVQKYMRPAFEDDEKHSSRFPKGTEKQTESTKDGKEGILDPSYLFRKSFIGHEKGTEKKIISTKDDKEEVLDSEHIFPTKTQ